MSSELQPPDAVHTFDGGGSDGTKEGDVSQIEAASGPRLYTEDEVRSLVERRMLERRVGEVEARFDNHQTMVQTTLAKFEATLDSLNRTMSQMAVTVRSDIEKDFVNKLEHQELRAEVKAMWGKLLLLGSIATIIGQVAIKVFF